MRLIDLPVDDEINKKKMNAQDLMRLLEKKIFECVQLAVRRNRLYRVQSTEYLKG